VGPGRDFVYPAIDPPRLTRREMHNRTACAGHGELRGTGRKWLKSRTARSWQRLAGPEKSEGAGGLRVSLPGEKRILFRDVGLAEGEGFEPPIRLFGRRTAPSRDRPGAGTSAPPSWCEESRGSQRAVPTSRPLGSSQSSWPTRWRLWATCGPGLSCSRLTSEASETAQSHIRWFRRVRATRARRPPGLRLDLQLHHALGSEGQELANEVGISPFYARAPRAAGSSGGLVDEFDRRALLDHLNDLPRIPVRQPHTALRIALPDLRGFRGSVNAVALER
jgi:hypothetical protein